ncbi:MAG TPA: aminotransferase class I/II-fold pyridoxal phosphate-dependent enzyme, partial [Candidatus Brocadiia bacterium]|nr:aminotransferase class I/II-fold pyridoxal phosphate-dependent enzyme [Candidatus Brocadiia bacterium]
LSIGQPDYDVPDEVKEAAIHAIRIGHNRYTLTQGLPTLRHALIERLKRDKNVHTEHLMVTAGVSAALMLAILTLIDRGDEVIIPDPYFVMYKHLVHLAEGEPVFVDTYPDFTVTAERLRPHITSRTRLILLNSPANPTGAVIPPDEMRKIVALAKHHNIPILSDEIYDCFSYSSDYLSPAAIYPNTILTGGFSKSHAMTGWRLAYITAPAEILDKMTMLQQYSIVCAPSFAQVAAVKALDVDMSDYTEDYREKRDRIYSGLVSAGYEVVKPLGAFYIFPKCPWGDSQSFVAEAIHNKLLIIPGDVFSERNTHFRISYAATDETIDKGIEILARLKKQGGPKA